MSPAAGLGPALADMAGAQVGALALDGRAGQIALWLALAAGQWQVVAKPPADSAALDLWLLDFASGLADATPPAGDGSDRAGLLLGALATAWAVRRNGEEQSERHLVHDSNDVWLMAVVLLLPPALVLPVACLFPALVDALADRDDQRHLGRSARIRSSAGGDDGLHARPRTGGEQWSGRRSQVFMGQCLEGRLIECHPAQQPEKGREGVVGIHLDGEEQAIAVREHELEVEALAKLQGRLRRHQDNEAV